MSTWYGTFGQGQKLHKNFVVLEGNSYDEVTQQMFHAYGNLWACIYNKQAFQGQPKDYNLSEVPLGTPNERIDRDDPGCEQDTGGGVLDFAQAVAPEEKVLPPLNAPNLWRVSLIGEKNLIIGQLQFNGFSYHEAMLLAAWIVHKARQVRGEDEHPLIDYLEMIAKEDS